MGAHTEGVEAQRLLALAGNGNHDRGSFDLVRLPTQPPVGVKQYLELRAGIDLMPAAPTSTGLRSCPVPIDSLGLLRSENFSKHRSERSRGDRACGVVWVH